MQKCPKCVLGLTAPMHHLNTPTFELWQQQGMQHGAFSAKGCFLNAVLRLPPRAFYMQRQPLLVPAWPVLFILIRDTPLPSINHMLIHPFTWGPRCCAFQLSAGTIPVIFVFLFH